jgi:hypothetical protein
LRERGGLGGQWHRSTNHLHGALYGSGALGETVPGWVPPLSADGQALGATDDLLVARRHGGYCPDRGRCSQLAGARVEPISTLTVCKSERVGARGPKREYRLQAHTYTRARGELDARGGLPPRCRSKSSQFLNSCSPDQRHDPAETTRAAGFREVSRLFRERPPKHVDRTEAARREDAGAFEGGADGDGVMPASGEDSAAGTVARPRWISAPPLTYCLPDPRCPLVGIRRI